MSPLDYAGAGLSLVGALKGLFGNRGPDPRQIALQQLAGQLGLQESDLINADRTNLMTQAGYGGDAVQALARRLGSDLAQGGVYNSSAVGGALDKAQQDVNSQIAQMATQNRLGEQSLIDQNQQYLTNARLGIAQNDVGYGRDQYQNALGGMASFLGKLAGQSKGRTTGRAANGMQNATLPSILQRPQGRQLFAKQLGAAYSGA